jgi:dTDP-4-dehydrorhamnose reductase
VSGTRRLLLFGASGQVGSEVARLVQDGWDVQAPDQADVDFIRPESLRELLRAVQPEVIVNAAAYTAVDRAESEPDVAHAVNALAPGVLAEEAARLGALLVHYSTDYVFDGSLRRPYKEADTPKPLSAYGRTKLDGERLVAAAGGRAVVLRTSWVYGPSGANFLLTMLRRFREVESVRVVNDQRGAPTAAHYIAEATKRVIDAAPDPSRSGLYHLAASGETTWHGFATAILAHCSKKVKCREVVPIRTSEYPTPARRPAYSLLDSSRFARRFGFTLRPWEALLDDVWAKLPQGVRC